MMGKLLLDDSTDTMLGYMVCKELVGDSGLQLTRCRASEHPLAVKLFEIKEIIGVVILPFSVEVHTRQDANALDISEKVEKVLNEFLA